MSAPPTQMVRLIRKHTGKLVVDRIQMADSPSSVWLTNVLFITDLCGPRRRAAHEEKLKVASADLRSTCMTE